MTAPESAISASASPADATWLQVRVQQKTPRGAESGPCHGSKAEGTPRHAGEFGGERRAPAQDLSDEEILEKLLALNLERA